VSFKRLIRILFRATHPATPNLQMVAQMLEAAKGHVTYRRVGPDTTLLPMGNGTDPEIVPADAETGLDC